MPTHPKMETIQVPLGRRGYKIRIAAGILNDGANPKYGMGSFTRLAVVTDETVEPLYADRFCAGFEEWGIDVARFVIPAGEGSKSVKMLQTLWEGFLEAGIGRDSAVIALGGGVIGDLAGFAAGTFMRGIPFFQVPTTLLAMVDSSVGGKTAVNLDGGKNMAGLFYQPSGVLIDTKTLDTLTERDYRAGLGEVVKYAVSLDADLFDYLEQHSDQVIRRDEDVLGEIIARCCRIKADIVRTDEKETSGVRALLNYGHTFAHAYEQAAGYEGIYHGEAVVLGAIDALKLAARLGRTNEQFAGIDAALIRREERLFKTLGLITSLSEAVDEEKLAGWSAESLFETMKKDKKSASGQIRLILPVRLGNSVCCSCVPARLIRDILRKRLKK